MERYWCLQWLNQEQTQRLQGQVIKENLVRMEGMPLVARVSGMPELAPGTRVEIRVGERNLLELEAELTYCPPDGAPA